MSNVILTMYAFSPSAHLLQVTAIEGLLEEVVPLLSVIPASPRPQHWLVTLEEKMRNTLVQCLAECVQRRLHGRESPSKLLQLMTTLGENLDLVVVSINRNRPCLEKAKLSVFFWELHFALCYMYSNKTDFHRKLPWGKQILFQFGRGKFDT